MRTKFLTSNSGDPSQQIAHTNFFIEQVCLVLVAQFTLINLLSHLFAGIRYLFPGTMLGMSIGSALAALCSAIALAIAERDRSPRLEMLGKVLAGLTTILAAISLCAACSPRLAAMGFLIHSELVPPGSEIAAASCLLFLGAAVLMAQAGRGFAAHLADAIASSLAFLILILGSEFLFACLKVPRASTAGLPSFAFLLCVGLLTIVIVIRRARHGVFSVFLGNGIAGRIARILAPTLILINLGRELGRARIVNANLVSKRYEAAVLASIATMISLVLLILLCRVINKMQSEIENLTLRDELTGLYSYRGFTLFAEQAFRLARRAGQPFAVLFVDMDNLKAINDELGHHEGSACLVEIARLLTATFRETDVIGRLGGDEFVVAGQLDAPGMLDAMERLRSRVWEARIPGIKASLSISMGYSVSEDRSDELMKSVLSRADKAMYREKRAKKRSGSGVLPKASTASNSDSGESVGSITRNSADEATAAL